MTSFEDISTHPVTSPIPFTDETPDEDNAKNEITEIDEHAVKVIKEPIELIIRGENTIINICHKSGMEIAITDTKKEPSKLLLPRKPIKNTKQYIRDHGEERYPSLMLMQPKNGKYENVDDQIIQQQQQCLELKKGNFNIERDYLKVSKEMLDKRKARLVESTLLANETTANNNQLESEKLWIAMEKQLISEERKIFHEEKRILEKEKEIIELEKKLLKQSEELLAEEREIIVSKKLNLLKDVDNHSTPKLPIYVPVYNIRETLFSSFKKNVHTQTVQKKTAAAKHDALAAPKLPPLGIFPSFFPRVVVARMNFQKNLSNDTANITEIPVDTDTDWGQKNAMVKYEATSSNADDMSPTQTDNIDTGINTLNSEQLSERTVESFHIGLPDDFYSNESDAAKKPSQSSKPLTSIGHDMYQKLSNYQFDIQPKHDEKTSSIKLTFGRENPIQIVIPPSEHRNQETTPILKSKLWNSDGLNQKWDKKREEDDNVEKGNRSLSITIENGATVRFDLGPQHCSCCSCHESKTRSVKVDTCDLGLAGGYSYVQPDPRQNLSPRTAGLLKALENKLKSAGSNRESDNVYIIKQIQSPKEDKGKVRTYYCQDCLTTMKLLDDNNSNVRHIVNKFENKSKSSLL